MSNTATVTMTNTATATIIGVDVVAVLETITATVDGLGLGLISTEATFADITSSSSAFIAALPQTSLGKRITGQVGANGCKIETKVLSSETINGVIADGTNQMTLPANHQFRAECLTSGAWIVEILGTNGWSFPMNPASVYIPTPS